MSRFRFAAATDTGLQREINEDRWYANVERGLFFVTDGMANEVTPHYIMETLPGLIREEFAGVEDVTPPGVAEKLVQVLNELNRDVLNQRLDLWTPDGGIGATLVLILARGDHLLVAHLGDSRVYLHEPRSLRRVTVDHSVVQELLDQGSITEAEALASRASSRGPTRYIGMNGVARAEIQPCTLGPEQRLILCTDGLTDMLLDEDILAVLEKYGDLDHAAQQLVAAANAAGGHDNITVLLIASDEQAV